MSNPPPRSPRLRSLLPIVLAANVAAGIGAPWLHAQGPGPSDRPDPRFKADLLLIVAHPDDDVLAGTYLARLVTDEGKRVAVAFTTSGQSGSNAAGPEHAASLGLIRQIEARRGLETLGITNVWFLGGRDTPGQDPRGSLAAWGHGRVLSEVVRVVRLTRPDVILTWLPMQVAGENHGDHQAAAVLATEAFDIAGDSQAFAEQLAAPVQTFESRYEGLGPWQPKKLYFMSDAMDTRFMDGQGPSYSITESSKAKRVPYWQFAYEQLRAHQTQYRPQLEQLAATDDAGRQRMLTQAPAGDALIDPLRLVLGKSVVGGAATADVFSQVTESAIPFAGAPRESAVTPAEPLLGLGGPWHFYRLFWRAHGLDQLPAIPTQPIGPVGSDAPVQIPLRLSNASPDPLQVTLRTTLPAGWTGNTPAAVTVPPGGVVEVLSTVTAGSAAAAGTATVEYVASTPGQTPSTLAVRILHR